MYHQFMHLLQLFRKCFHAIYPFKAFMTNPSVKYSLNHAKTHNTPQVLENILFDKTEARKILLIMSINPSIVLAYY